MDPNWRFIVAHNETATFAAINTINKHLLLPSIQTKLETLQPCAVFYLVPLTHNLLLIQAITYSQKNVKQQNVSVQNLEDMTWNLERCPMHHTSVKWSHSNLEQQSSDVDWSMSSEN